MSNILINHRSRMNIPSTPPITLPIPRKQPRMIPLPNHNRRDSRDLATQSLHRIFDCRHLEFPDLGELPLCNTVTEVHYPRRVSICILLVQSDEFGDHGPDALERFLPIGLIEK